MYKINTNILGRYAEPHGWTRLTKACYNRGCVCSGCPENEIIKKSQTCKYCHVKALVLELVRRYGRP